ncbi:hypothetical protein LEPN108286_01620 [Legionella pneumophila subsp. pneumophila]
MRRKKCFLYYISSMEINAQLNLDDNFLFDQGFHKVSHQIN